MQKEEKELIEEKFKGVYLHQQSNFDFINEKLEQIYKQTQMTNGRVTTLECQTKIVRFFESKPIMLLLVLLGIIFAASFVDLQEFIKMF